METKPFCISTDAVKKIALLWEGSNDDNIDIEGVDGIEYVKVKDTDMVFDEIKAGEELLDSIFARIENGDKDIVVGGILLLDSIYHTQIKYSLHFAIKLKAKLYEYDGDCRFIDKIKEANDAETAAYCVNTIAQLVKEEGKEYAYSFATKFCNRINRKAFPIFDRYVAWMLNYYIHKLVKDRNAYTQTSFGDYSRFISAYKFFRENILTGENKESIDFKELDIFMWTTGKAINRGADVMYIAPELQQND